MEQEHNERTSGIRRNNVSGAGTDGKYLNDYSDDTVINKERVYRRTPLALKCGRLLQSYIKEPPFDRRCVETACVAKSEVAPWWFAEGLGLKLLSRERIFGIGKSRDSDADKEFKDTLHEPTRAIKQYFFFIQAALSLSNIDNSF